MANIAIMWDLSGPKSISSELNSLCVYILRMYMAIARKNGITSIIRVIQYRIIITSMIENLSCCGCLGIISRISIAGVVWKNTEIGFHFFSFGVSFDPAQRGLVA